MTDRVERLRQVARTRHETTLARATATLQSIARNAEPVTFGGLARAAGVSRSWLYQQTELRAQIEALRQSQAQRRTRPQPAQSASTDSLRQQLHLHRDEIARLRAENHALKDQLARHLGDARAAAVTQPG